MPTRIFRKCKNGCGKGLPIRQEKILRGFCSLKCKREFENKRNPDKPCARCGVMIRSIWNAKYCVDCRAVMMEKHNYYGLRKLRSSYKELKANDITRVV